MTLQEVYRAGKEKLAGVEAASFEAMCIFKHCFGIDRSGLAIHGDKQLPDKDVERFWKLILERVAGRPLQYILGEWEFMGQSFKVGEGVLVPRDDTEILVRVAQKLVYDKKEPKILELCAGSGIISIILAIWRPDAKITCVEVSDSAVDYLKENVKRFANDFLGVGKIDIVQGDMFEKPVRDLFDMFDLIVCNPPYIPSDEIKYLQKEVQNEPRVALDGGTDGLNFFRELTSVWGTRLAPGGALAVEVGKGQANSVTKLFEEAKFNDISVYMDISEIKRVVSGKKE